MHSRQKHGKICIAAYKCQITRINNKFEKFCLQFDKLKDPLVWRDAATQIFYSLGVAYGSLIAFASYNPMKSECNRDAIHVCLVNCGVSIYASVVVFCFIGFQAEVKMEECLGKQLQERTSEHYITTIAS